MEFFDVRPNVGSEPIKPRISAAAGVVTITIPTALAEHVGWEGARAVRVQFGRDDKGTAIRLRPEAGAPWLLKKKKGVQVLVPELTPLTDIVEQDVDYAEAEGALTLTLPAPWELSNTLALKKAAPPKRNGGANGAARQG